MLIKKPLSGSEIVEIIEKETGGRWIPSPGSIYPLLARLHKTGYTSESPDQETGMKRYKPTVKGKKFFQKQITFGQKLLDKLEFIVPLLISGFQFDPNDEKILSGTRKSAKRVVMTLLDLRPTKVKLTEQDVKKMEEILNNCADELERIAHRSAKKGKQKRGRGDR
jgi:DNA-binding PadR family transcriptional regulator